MTRLVFSWEFVGPHHRSRIISCMRRDPTALVRVFSLTDRSSTYGFYSHDEGESIASTVAYRSQFVEQLGLGRRLLAYARHLWASADDVFFLCHYERLEVFLTAIVLRLRRKRVYVMNDSKFDDYDRILWREVLKSLLYIPYCGALVSGKRSVSYLRFLGFGRPIETGYDTIDTLSPVSEPGVSQQRGDFFITVGRLVGRKNVECVIRAFHIASSEISPNVELIVVGDGPQRQSLLDLTRELNIEHKVKFSGNIPNRAIGSLLSRAIALILMSTSEQWGLVINEAIACGVPVIVSDAVGARDSLVRSFINGFVVESDNDQGLARAMAAVYSQVPKLTIPDAIVRAADVGRFADGVWSLINK